MRKVLPLAMFLGLAACSTPDIGQAPGMLQATGNELPPPNEIDATGEYVYSLGRFDKVSVQIEGMPDLTSEVSIDGQGMLSFPFAGTVHAEGLTPEELSRLMEDRMRAAHVRNPHVSVNIVEQISHVVTVDGQVRTPGLYPVQRDMTLSKAVALAGGENEFARTSLVLVFREVADQEYVGVYDLGGIRYGNYEDPPVYANDRVVVSAARARQLLSSFQGVTQIFTTPLVLLLRR